MEEIYRSFDGKLGAEQQEGYILYSVNSGDLIEYEGLSVWENTETARARIPARYLPETDYGNLEKIGELIVDCYNGNLPGGQIHINGKWWSYNAICKIQEQHQDNHWMRYI